MRTRTIICALAALGLLIVPLAATPAWVDSAAARAGDASPALASSSLASELPAAVAEAGLSAEDWAGIQRQIAAQEAEPSQPAAGAVSTPDQTEDKKLTANDGAARDYFGNSVAICGDTLVVGAPLADVDGKADQGAAYVFYRHHGGAHNWGQVKKLTASDGHAGDWFGVSVAISGDTILVGAHRDYEFVTFRGSAYVFYRNQGGANNWGQVKRLLASDGREGDYFGGSVAVWGDIALVTADGDDVGANADQGSAYVFYRNHGGTDNWGQVKKLTASDGAAGDSLGTSAAIYGDTAVVGAYGDDIGANADQGSAYAFYRNAGGADNWGQVKKLTASDGAAGDWFGYSAAIWEDTVVVGAYYGKVGANRQGTAYVFSRHLGGADQWGQVQKLSASDGAVGDNFGFSVAISGDLVVAGSPRDDTGTNFDQGSAYVFYRHQGGADNWGQLHKLTASDGAARDYFGASVAMWTGAWVVGADGDDVSANTDQGAAYVFTCGATGPTVSQVTASLDGKAGDDIGTFVSLPGKGVPVLNTFTAQVSPAVCPVQRVTFTLGGQIKTDDNGADGWSAQFDMSELPAGSQDLQVQAYDQGNAGPVKTVKVHVLPKPAYVDGSWVLNPTVSWSAAGQKYTFTGTVPHNPAFGPYVKNFSIRYLGTLHNVFASQVSITETFLISGKWEAKASGALNATLLNVPLAYLPYSVVPHLDSTTGGVAYYDVPTMSFPLEQKKKKVYRGVVYSSGGIFNVSMSIDYGFNATLSTWGTIRGDWSVAKMQLRPDVTASLEFGVWVDILFGVASAGVSATPAFGIGLPVVYQDDPPPGGGSVYLDKPCSHFDVKGRVWASVGWWKLKKTWNWGPYTFYCWDDPSSPSCWCASHAAALALDETQPPEPDLFAAPWLANNGAGKIMAVWIQDQDPDPLEPDPEVAYALWDGTAWSSSQLVTQNDRWESDPRVAFLGPNEALAVWTQNELSPDQTSEETPLTEVLSQQELYYAHWDGVRWTTPARLTHDALPDGRAALASDPLHGQALLAWVHDGDGSPESKGDWDLHYMVWDANGWSTPAPLAADPAVAALEVYLRYDSQGKAMAVWVQDHDADLNTNADRRVAYAMWDGQAWSAPVEPATWPTGALYPSVAFDSADRPIVVFTSRGTLESGEEAGVGNYDSLWSAYRKGDWVVQPVGVDTAAEWPRVLVNAEDQAIVVFRQFGEAGTVHFTGEVAAAVADLTQPTLQWGPPDLLTEEGGPNWQIAFDIDPNTGTTEVLYIKGAPASASSQLQALGNDGDQLYGLSLPFAPDLRIRPADIAFSNEHPIAGETIKITATVRNKGFQAVDAPVTVRFFRGDPDAGGTLIGQGTTGPAMAFGESSEVAITWAALGGRQDVYVLVDPNQQTADFQRDNNKAFRTVGTMPAPGGLVAATYPASNSILLSWTAPDTGGIAGYYVYRSTTSGSGYSLIANVSTTSYEDAGLPDDVVYYYVVVAYDAYGVRSEHSNEASASLPGIYTPTPTNTPTVTPTPTHTPTRTASPTRTPGRILLPVILKG